MREALLPVLALYTMSWLVFLPTRVEGFDLGAHDALSRRAVQNSRLDNFLRGQLEFLIGSAEVIKGLIDSQTVTGWVAVGSRLEDSPVFRVKHHFHNPTLPWDRAGLHVLGLKVGESSVLWGQDRGQVIGGKHSWHDARAAFFQALTATTDAERQRAYAETFLSLGHLIHLVQDAASPAHARNDSHLSFFGIGDPDGFHSWAEDEDNLNTILASPSQPFDPFILTLPPNPLAPVPIARILDTESYRRTAIPEAGTNIGIAEYSNANFFSDDTIFSGFPFPGEGSVELGPPEVEPKTKELRRYLRKARDGEIGYRLAVPSAFFETLEAALADQEKGLDDLVFQDYGRLLFPRAIGYSAGLLDYFFRGRLQASFAPGSNGGREVILGTQNVTGEPIGPGTLRLLYDDDSGERRLIREESVPDLGGASELPALQFDVPAGPLSQYVVVYRGQLGLEADAVIGRVLGDFPIVAVQQLAALTGAEFEEFTPSLGGGGGWVRQKDPNQQRAAGSFWAGTGAGVGRKIREVRLEEDDGLLGTPPQAVLRLNGKEVGTEWRAAEDPGLIPEDWEVVLTPIPAKTLATGVKPPPALWVNGFRTPLLWIESVITATGQFTFLRHDGVPVWITTRGQRTGFYFGDGVRGLDPQRGTPLTTPRTGVSFRPVGEAAGGPVPRAEFEFLLGDCLLGNPLFRFRFVFAVRSTNVFFGGCEVGSDVRWAKNLLWLQERVQTLGAQPDPALPLLLTAATFRREFLDADLERFLSVGIVPLEYDIRTE